MWVYPPNCRTQVGARWSPSFPRQSLARRRARNIVQVHAHALNGSWECYHVVRIGLGAIWGDHGRRRSLHFTTPHLSEKGLGIPTVVHFPFFFSNRGGVLPDFLSCSLFPVQQTTSGIDHRVKYDSFFRLETNNNRMLCCILVHLTPAFINVHHQSLRACCNFEVFRIDDL